MKCLLQRRYCYDLFDLVYGAFVAKDIEVNRTEIMQVFLRKTIFGDSPLAAKNLLLDLPLDLFRGYWSKVVCPAAGRMSFDDAVLALRSGLDSLFEPASTGAHLVAAFFPSALRNPILEAGSSQRLLALSYDGVERQVEPYSLNFKRRRDGVAQEYLYVYDRTGGRSSGPGIKSLVHQKIQGLRILENTFEPRYQVNLSKAGDSDIAGYFTGSPGPRRTTTAWGRTSYRSSSSGPRYVIQCSYCSKQFRRKTSSTRLNKHNDRYGNPCYGRTGFLVRYL
jgi:hypothetical protein